MVNSLKNDTRNKLDKRIRSLSGSNCQKPDRTGKHFVRKNANKTELFCFLVEYTTTKLKNVFCTYNETTYKSPNWRFWSISCNHEEADSSFTQTICHLVEPWRCG